jgi:hypothetical protein
MVIGFPGNKFSGEIIPELERLVDAGTISIVDGILALKDAAGDLLFVEFAELDSNHDAARLGVLMQQLQSFVSEEDIIEFTDGLPPDSSAAILVFEHTWVKPLRNTLLRADAMLIADFRVPGMVVDALLDELGVPA